MLPGEEAGGTSDRRKEGSDEPMNRPLQAQCASVPRVELGYEVKGSLKWAGDEKGSGAILAIDIACRGLHTVKYSSTALLHPRAHFLLLQKYFLKP